MVDATTTDLMKAASLAMSLFAATLSLVIMRTIGPEVRARRAALALIGAALLLFSVRTYAYFVPLGPPGRMAGMVAAVALPLGFLLLSRAGAAQAATGPGGDTHG